MRILSYNIRRGGRGREDEIASVISSADADLTILQEAVDPGVVERIAAKTGSTFFASKPGYSVAAIARCGIAEHRWLRPRPMRRAFLEIVPAGRPTIYGVHLSATHSNLTERLRLGELRSMVGLVRGNQPGPHIFAGDFNTLAPGELLDHQRLPPRLRMVAWANGGRVRYKTIDAMLTAGYVDVFRSMHAEPGFTFPTWDPHVRLDFFFVPAPWADHATACEVITLPETVRQASDHFPLAAEFAE